jgi:hypothetical protein
MVPKKVCTLLRTNSYQAFTQEDHVRVQRKKRKNFVFLYKKSKITLRYLSLFGLVWYLLTVYLSKNDTFSVMCVKTSTVYSIVYCSPV